MRRVFERTPFPQRIKKVDTIDKDEANAIGRLVMLSMIGFLVSGWFLSRAFATTLFLLGGMAEVIYQVMLDRGMIGGRLRLGRVFQYSAALGVGLVVAVYVSLRIMNVAR